MKIFESQKEIELSKLIDSRMIVMANSGAGKSYLVRKVLEESHGKVLSIVLDFEGEFKTLREKYDYLLIGHDSDVEISLNSAKILPKKLLELNIPTIIDISDFKRPDRIRYVKLFLEGLMEAKRELWKPCLIVLDEIHNLAGQQEKQDSCSAVIDLATRGRKRGFCLIGATQRISKLHKDVVAELNNYMVGRTSLDIDMKRSGDILGFNSKESILSLRNLNDGEFYVFGPAISKTIEKEQVARSKTTHPKQGMDLSEIIIPPTQKVKGIISKLNELPKEQAKELKEKQDFIKEINSLRKEVTLLKKGKLPLNIKVDTRQVEKAKKEGWDLAENAYKKEFQEIKNKLREYEDIFYLLNNPIKRLNEVISKKQIKFSQLPRKLSFHQENHGRGSLERESGVLLKPVGSKQLIELNEGASPSPYANNNIVAGAKRILNACAMFYPNPISKPRAGAIAGLSYKSGSFNTYISTLKREGLIEQEGNEYIITELGLEQVGEVQPLPSGEELVNLWCNIVKGGASRILRVLYENYPNSLSKEEVGELAELSPNSGSFNTYLSTLKRNGLIKVNRKEIKLSEELNG